MKAQSISYGHFNVENAFNKLQYPFMVKLFKNKKGNFLNLIKGIYEKPIAKLRGFSGSKTTLFGTIIVDTGIIHLSKSIELYSTKSEH